MTDRLQYSQRIAAARAGFSERTAHSLEADPRLPSHRQPARGRTVPDPLEAVWEPFLLPILERDPAVQAVTLLRHLQMADPDAFPDDRVRPRAPCSSNSSPGATRPRASRSPPLQCLGQRLSRPGCHRCRDRQAGPPRDHPGDEWGQLPPASCSLPTITRGCRSADSLKRQHQRQARGGNRTVTSTKNAAVKTGQFACR